MDYFHAAGHNYDLITLCIHASDAACFTGSAKLIPEIYFST